MPKYYTLLSIDPNPTHNVHIEFGSYSRSEVKAEQTDFKESGSFIPHTSTAILEHADDLQSTIDADIATFKLRLQTNQPPHNS